MSRKRLVIAGGSGFIGRALTREFSGRGFEVVVLTRSPHKRTDGVVEAEWDGTQVGAWATLLDGADAIINLTGKNINCPHTQENLRDIAASRVNSVNAIAAAIDRAKNPPGVWGQASAVGYYGEVGDAVHDENSPAGKDILAEICQKWEAAFAAANSPQTRKVALRIGFVLGRDGGVLPLLSKMTRGFLGGAAGSGRQYVSWIHIADLAAMFVAGALDEKLSGTFNAVGPNAVTNAEFMRELRHALHRPWSPPAPGFVVKLGAALTGSEGSLALASQRCVPKRFLAAGFKFRFTDVATALKDLCGGR